MKFNHVHMMGKLKGFLFGSTTPPPKDPQFADVVCLLHFDGSDGSTVIVDSTNKTNPEANNGASLSTLQAKFGTASLRVSGVAAPSVTIPDSTDLRFTAGQDGTIEGWFYMLAPGIQALFAKTESGAAPYNHMATDGTSWYVYLGDSGTDIQVPTNGTLTNTWHHIALVSHNGVWTLYDNGTALGTYTGGTFGDNAGPFMIGNWPSDAPFNGFIDEFRVSRVARYTADFTPPTAPFLDQ